MPTHGPTEGPKIPFLLGLVSLVGGAALVTVVICSQDVPVTIFRDAPIMVLKEAIVLSIAPMKAAPLVNSELLL